LAQQRTTQTELEDQRRQVQELLQSRKQLQAQLADVTDRLELELVAKNDETGQYRNRHRNLVLIRHSSLSAARRKLQGQLQELEVAENASSSVQSGSGGPLFSSGQRLTDVKNFTRQPHCGRERRSPISHASKPLRSLKPKPIALKLKVCVILSAKTWLIP